LAAANLTGANLDKAFLGEADLTGANFDKALLRETNLTGANLDKAFLREADLTGANLSEADLSGANLAGAKLIDAHLIDARLIDADLSGADLSGADLRRATLLDTDFARADLTGCRIHGISAWGLKLERTKQQNLVITRRDEPEITVDNIEVAQFIYLMLHNEKIRDVIDTGTARLGTMASSSLGMLLGSVRSAMMKRAMPIQPLLEGTSRPYSMFRDYWK
jgi:uncharacterized protein YjbI with pentapeptide repeats